MTITIEGHDFACELERLSGLFYPDERVRFVAADEPHDPLHASVVKTECGDGYKIVSTLTSGERELCSESVITSAQNDDRQVRELALADGLYELLRELSGYTPPWGMLTGVRPVKLLRMLLEDGSMYDARAMFTDRFHCSEEKFRLSAETVGREQSILARSRDDSFSLYISIPFCPSRCNYCSFVSQSVEKAAKLIPGYVELLAKEIEATAALSRELGLRLETVYMGGGTPTTLSAEQMAFILGRVNDCFDMSTVSEFTVEAGRPDTITPEKLAAIKNAGVRRISINPQTLSDEVLRNIGRRHTAAQVYEAMAMARAAGFDDINMDMIAGLSGDTPESFARSLEGVLSMEPENITVHSLAMKRASNLVTGGMARPDAVGSQAGEMLSLCADVLPRRGYHPYYLYRQTRMVGNLENVGWALEGHDGLYNVYIMDETHTILAVGAGGVTKLRQPRVNNIQRVYNYKFPYEYITRFDTILERKERVKEFYAEFC